MNLLGKFFLGITALIQLVSAQESTLDVGSIRVNPIANLPDFFTKISAFEITQGNLPFNEAGELSWITDVIQWFLEVFVRHLFRGVRDPINVPPIYVDVEYGPLLSLRGYLENAQVRGFSGLNITILDLSLGNEEFLIKITQLSLLGYIPEVEGHIFSGFWYQGTLDFAIDLNVLKIHVLNGVPKMTLEDIEVYLFPNYSPGSLAKFSIFGVILLVFIVNAVFTVVILVRRIRTKIKSGEMKLWKK